MCLWRLTIHRSWSVLFPICHSTDKVALYILDVIGWATSLTSLKFSLYCNFATMIRKKSDVIFKKLFQNVPQDKFLLFLLYNNLVFIVIEHNDTNLMCLNIYHSSEEGRLWKHSVCKCQYSERSLVSSDSALMVLFCIASRATLDSKYRA